MKFSLTFVLGIILLVASVQALGITPARTTIDFVSNGKGEVPFSIISTEAIDADYVVYVQGELNQSIKIKENIFKMKKDEKEKQLQYTYHLPQDLEPGLHTAEVVVLQLPSGGGTSEAFVGAAVGVATQLYVYVPYPGKFVVGELHVINAEAGKDTSFIIPVVSKGNLDIASVKVNIDVYTKLQEKVASFNSADVPLKSNEKKDIVVNWKAAVPVGNYRAVATVIYDGATFQLERTFSVGSAVLDLQQVESKEFSLGEIAKIEMLVENKWSEPIQGAYSETEVYNAEGKTMSSFKSPTYDIEPLTKAILTSFWDTSGVQEGTYDAAISLKYGSASIKKDLKFKVSENSLETIGLGYVISETKSAKGSSNITFILIVVVGVLVLINLSWFLVLRRYMKKKSS